MKLICFCFLFLHYCALMGDEQTENTSQKNMRIIINSRIGKEKATAIEKLIVDRLDHRLFKHEIRYTQRTGQAIELSRDAVKEGRDVVVAVGGDGTVNEVGKALIGTNVKLGIIPAGSGNGLARHLNIPTDIDQAIQVLNAFNSTKIDTINVNDDYALGTVGFGFDAHIAWKFARVDKRGYRAYKGLVLREYFGYHPKSYEVIMDGKKKKAEGLLLTFANSSQYGNNYKIAPQANISDGVMQMAILQKPPIFHLYDIVNRVKNGTIHQSKFYQSFPCKEVTIKQPRLLAHIDGEPAYFEDGVHIKLLPLSLSVLTPINQ